MKKVRWQPKLITIHEIEAEGKQKPTSATLIQQKEHAAKKRAWCTNRSKRYRDQLVDWVITLHQLHALNSNNEPHCPSPRLILHKPNRTILQRPHRPEPTCPSKPIPKGNPTPNIKQGSSTISYALACSTSIFFRLELAPCRKA